MPLIFDLKTINKSNTPAMFKDVLGCMIGRRTFCRIAVHFEVQKVICTVMRPTLMGTKNLNENGPNLFFSGLYMVALWTMGANGTVWEFHDFSNGTVYGI